MLSVKLTMKPIEAKSVEAIPRGDEWQYEPKWEGFRCIAFRDGDKIQLQSKSGRPLGCYFPDVVEALRQLGAKKFVLDGEIAIPVRPRLSFHHLLMRIHPVGFTSSFDKTMRVELAATVEPLRSTPGFTGRAPDSLSRWTTAESTLWEPLRTNLVVEVVYDQFSGDRFRHGTKFLRWRPDKSPRLCTFT